MNQFRDRVAVITGGASGIGRAMADRFAREGMRIVIGDVEVAALDKTVRELKSQRTEAVGVHCDVAELAQVEALAAAAFDNFGAVHILCNNAGVASQAAPCWAQTDADWKWVLGVNLWGVIHGIRAFVPRMLKQGSEGHIVNTASLAGLLSMPYGAPYNVSKFGVVALTEALHYELAISGAKLKASVLCPAWVRTNILDSDRNRPAELGAAGTPEINEEWTKAFRSRLDEGLTAETVAERVFQAVCEEQLYIWTHPEYKPTVQMRMEDIVAGRNPDIRKMMGGLAGD